MGLQSNQLAHMVLCYQKICCDVVKGRTYGCLVSLTSAALVSCRFEAHVAASDGALEALLHAAYLRHAWTDRNAVLLSSWHRISSRPDVVAMFGGSSICCVRLAACACFNCSSADAVRREPGDCESVVVHFCVKVFVKVELASWWQIHLCCVM